MDDFAAFMTARYQEAEAQERELIAWAPGRELFVGTAKPARSAQQAPPGHLLRG